MFLEFGMMYLFSNIRQYFWKYGHPNAQGHITVPYAKCWNDSEDFRVSPEPFLTSILLLKWYIQRPPSKSPKTWDSSRSRGKHNWIDAWKLYYFALMNHASPLPHKLSTQLTALEEGLCSITRVEFLLNYFKGDIWGWSSKHGGFTTINYFRVSEIFLPCIFCS